MNIVHWMEEVRVLAAEKPAQRRFVCKSDYLAKTGPNGIGIRLHRYMYGSDGRRWMRYWAVDGDTKTHTWVGHLSLCWHLQIVSNGKKTRLKCVTFKPLYLAAAPGSVPYTADRHSKTTKWIFNVMLLGCLLEYLCVMYCWSLSSTTYHWCD